MNLTIRIHNYVDSLAVNLFEEHTSHTVRAALIGITPDIDITVRQFQAKK